MCKSCHANCDIVIFLQLLMFASIPIYRTVARTVSSIKYMFVFTESGDKPETIKRAAALSRGRVFTNTFIHFLRFTSDKTAQPITPRSYKKTSPTSKFKLQGIVASFSFFPSLEHLHDFPFTKRRRCN